MYIEDKSVPLIGREPVYLKDRNITAESLEKYGITLGFGGDNDDEVSEHYYPYLDKSNNLVASKVRVVEGKEFFCTGDINAAGLFGKQLCPAGGKYITITEGELDAVSVYQMTGFPAVSVKSSSSAVRDIKSDYEYVNSFDNIILCFDRDEGKMNSKGEMYYPGQEAANKVASMFKAGKVKIVNLHPYKDANDFLKVNANEEFKRAWWKAQVYQLDGIVCGNSLWDEITKKETHLSVPYPFEGLNEQLYGLRTSEMITLTAGTGVGKTTLLKHIAVHIKNTAPEGVNVGMLMLEETLRESSLGLMSVAARAPLHLPTTKVSDAEMERAFKEVLGEGRFFFHDHFGSTSIDNIIDKVDKMITQYDCKYIVLDHISIVVSDQQSGDERRALDEIATKLKTLTVAKDVCLIIVCHLKRVNGKPAEEGGQISLSDLRGTAGIGQLSNLVLALERDLQGGESESNRVRIRVLKDRFAGRTGVACELSFAPPPNKVNKMKFG